MTNIRPTKLIAAILAIALLAIGPSGCIRSQHERGIPVKWATQSEAPAFTSGKTTRDDVLKALGPPSQIVGLKDETVLYYLREKKKTKGLILIVYNDVRVNVRFDRAIFIFDKRGVLTDFSTSVTSDDSESS